MSKKLKRSAVALVLAATMVFSSQGVLTAFAVGENETSTAVDVSALEPILDKEETVVVEEPGNTDETEPPEVTEPCGITEGCTLPNGHPGECQVAPVDPPVEDENGEDETQPCTKTEGCTLENGHEGECVTEPVTPPEEENGEDETQPCEKTEGCTLPNGHEGECVVEENTEDTEDTQEPSEEDVAAAKNVSDLIGALPEASTLDPETTDVEVLTAQVKAAREAYDKLTDAQKALVEKAVLDKLVALEGALEALQNTNVAAEGDVAQIGDHFYSTLSSAISAANSGDTIYILKDFTLDSRITYKDKEITIAAADNSTFTIEDNSRCGISISGDSKLTFKNLTFATNGQIYLYNNANLTFQNSTLNMDGEMYQFHSDGYYCIAIALENRGTSLSFNDSTVDIANYPSSGSAIRWDDSIGGEGYAVSIVNTEFTSSNCYSGFVGTCNILIDNSRVHVKHRGNGSNGSNFDVKNYSNVVFEGNGSHGISATSLNISDHSVVTSTNNKMYGIYVSNGFSVDGTSTLNVTQNSSGGDFAGLKLTSGVTDGLVEDGATVNITDNYCSGLSNNGVCEFEEGVKLTITGNDNDKGTSSHGGGIYNSGNAANLTLPSDAVIYNNHADTAGDDIFNNTTSTITFGKVGSDWVLDDCNHTITGWFDDSANSRWNVHTGPVHAELYEDATTAVTGVLALKAAHPYQYDPEAPTEPSEPVKWETSKSKTATNLDTNYESQVTLSLPAAETVPVTDVVFVLDRSSSAGAARQEISDMMDNLLEIVNNSDAVINVGVVNFWYKADSGIELTALTSESIDSIKNAIMEGNLSGTNIEAGIDAAVAMLDASSTPAENKYMVLVTDGLSHAWNDQNGEVKTIWGQGTADYSVVFNGANSYYYFDTTKTSFQTVFDTPSGDTQLNSNYEVPVFDAESVIEVLEDTEYADYYIRQGEYESYYSGVEKGVYEAAHAYANAASKYKCINLYWEVSGYPIASEFMEWTNEQGKCYNISDDLSGAFDEVEREITYVVDAGSQVIDVIGGDDDGVNYDYDFDFVDVVSLTVGGEELDFTKDGNTYYFGESRDGIYPFVLTYYPNGLGVATMDIEDETVVAGELFVWEINVPITIDKSVQLTYTVKLANPKTADGTYGQYDEDGSKNYDGLYTNNSAVLFPVDSNGNVGEKEAFDKPTVSYTVGGNDNPGTDPTPDPDPDPDRPSRPNRDDDDDWEPLPDAPVKDKPTTEVDVPEETETPTTEQPDKYNPETGDTTTVFAAMALAAVSLGGVVLLGRKKK